MLCFPNAKINLGLNIIEKRPDGFHNIETVFYPFPLCDALEIAQSDSNETYEFSSSGIPIGIDPSQNIVIKAFDLIASKFEIPSTAIHLHKNIPFGAGLGGGSADAAYMIKMLNDFYSLGLSIQQMEEFAIQIGSDCPVFIKNEAVFAEGKGEIFSSIQLDLSGYHIALIKPDIHISTPEAYSGVSPKKPEKSVKELIKLPLKDWKENIFNDFEDSIFPNHPELKKLKEELYESGAIYAAMSGSGSSMFGIFEREPEIQENWKKHFIWSGKL
ncbi:4-(cytidine 5'-diphospho)-2-C-methyl-D-erythritol kinase [Marinifilum caeruleilacunae]|uniref:4-diphosphocytidyl-2-C-methyl-D-erythritol kinase n=1 Tax=Marinifilum caeruleilacunae TaxID=2499076 RepID=A0ABX1X0D7_9BACT|nr:4-(cytidine 5'-diphospho)-2-C-methyl-D-erythritol kinase [Marinifilum caeruleilacunae]NOU61875.1 4-(cytidine 5'-diphospho)-2-C-methyl-D-erythritol kinase [Marinifilum caeruleilacunae]